MTGFTPGPWSVPHFATDHQCNCQYVLSDGQYGMGAIATVHHNEDGSDGAEHNEPLGVAIANANLIVAAPELFEALEGVVAVADRATAEFDRARAALAKAKGETQ